MKRMQLLAAILQNPILHIALMRHDVRNTRRRIERFRRLPIHRQIKSRRAVRILRIERRLRKKQFPHANRLSRRAAMSSKTPATASDSSPTSTAAPPHPPSPQYSRSLDSDRSRPSRPCSRCASPATPSFPRAAPSSQIQFFRPAESQDASAKYIYSVPRSFGWIGTPSSATTSTACACGPNKTCKLKYVIAEAFSTRHSCRSPGFIVIVAGG